MNSLGSATIRMEFTEEEGEDGDDEDDDGMLPEDLLNEGLNNLSEQQTSQ